MDITRRQLVKAIKDMNQVMELDPPIDTSGSVDSILDQLDEAIESCVDPADEFTMETWDIINARQNGELVVVESQVKEKKPPQGENQSKEEKKKQMVVGQESSRLHPVLIRLKEIVDQGKFSKKEVREMLYKEFPQYKKSTINTYFYDSMSEKYTKFDKPVIEKEGILQW